MSDDKKQMTELQIAAKIKGGKPFFVPSKRERSMAYACAKYLGVKIATRGTGFHGFDVYFLNGGGK